MIKIAYITDEQYSTYNQQKYSDFGIFSPMRDDVTLQYYITQYEIENFTVLEFSWLIYLNLVDVPPHEQYKFKT